MIYKGKLNSTHSAFLGGISIICLTLLIFSLSIFSFVINHCTELKTAAMHLFFSEL